MLAAEQVVGARGIGIVLRQSSLEQLIGNYPADNFDAAGGFTFGDYANLCTELMNFFGRPGKSMTLRIGRISADYTYKRLDERFKLSTLTKASKLLPAAQQLQAALIVSQKVLTDLSKQLGQSVDLKVENRGDTIAYIDKTCIKKNQLFLFH